MTAKIVKLREVDGVICADTLDIARNFHKRHDNVLQDVDRIVEAIKSTPSNVRALGWFRAETYYDQKQEQRRRYDMTEEGFALVVGRYTGTEPLEWQIAYHTEFQRMKGLLGRAGAPAAHGLFESKGDPEHRDNVVAFQGPPRPQGDLFSSKLPDVPSPSSSRYHYPNDDAVEESTEQVWLNRPDGWRATHAKERAAQEAEDSKIMGGGNAESIARVGGDRWTDHHEDHRFQVINDFDSRARRRLWVTCNYRGEAREFPIVAPDGSPLVVCINEPFAPIEVIERNYDKLGRGPYAAIGKATLRHVLS